MSVDICDKPIFQEDMVTREDIIKYLNEIIKIAKSHHDMFIHIFHCKESLKKCSNMMFCEIINNNMDLIFSSYDKPIYCYDIMLEDVLKELCENRILCYAISRKGPSFTTDGAEYYMSIGDYSSSSSISSSAL